VKAVVHDETKGKFPLPSGGKKSYSALAPCMLPENSLRSGTRNFRVLVPVVVLFPREDKYKIEYVPEEFQE
jgi:hypothetical protein